MQALMEQEKGRSEFYPALQDSLPNHQKGRFTLYLGRASAIVHHLCSKSRHIRSTVITH
jgi:hypothetical protein